MRRNLFATAIAALILSIVACANAYAGTASGDDTDPVGTMSYCLPNTSLAFEVEAVKETFYAGPYAKYAQKYLGIDVRQSDQVTYRLTSVKMTPYIEADQSSRYLLTVGSKGINATFLSLTSCGLIAASSDSSLGTESIWRFPVEMGEDDAETGLISNVSSTTTTLYQNVKEESAYTRVSVQQEVMVAKTVEQKAAETASLIFDLRKKRIQILTGDTDATYSGEAMGAAVAEIARLEKEYMSMFAGYTTTSVQTMRFDVVPEKSRTMYVAFRFSESAGLLNSDDLSGKPVVLEITPNEIPSPSGNKKSGSVGSSGYAVYRIPAICTLKLSYGNEALMTTRLPIHQYGIDSTFPLNSKTN